MKKLRLNTRAGVIAVLMVTGVTGVWADGLRNPPEGAAALGRAGIRLTQGDDPSAITHNPANLMDLKSSETMASATIGYATRKYTSPQGQSEKSEDPWTVLPAAYAAWPVQNGEYVVGIGLTVPYGQSTTWDENGIMKFRGADYGRMRTVNANPTIATKLGEDLTAGVGVDILWSDMKFKQSLPPGVAGPVSSRLTFDGDGWGYGANAGLTWQATPGQRVAVAYRSAIKVDYEGDNTIANPFMTSSADAELDGVEFPAVLGLGYGLQVTPAVRAEANVEWVQHSVNKTWTQGATTLPQDWNDTWTVGLGADWQLNKEWVLRGGWVYLPTPIPEDTMAPVLSEGDKHVLAVGVGYKRGAQSVDLAYAYNICEDRDVTDPMSPVSGHYEFEAHLIAASYVLSF